MDAPPEPPPGLASAGWDDLLSGTGPWGPTHALVLQQGGRVVAEAYTGGVSPAATLASWSVAKSVLHAVVGLLVGDGRVALHERVWAPEWSDDDPRSALTVDQALRMTAGLAWAEDYAEGAEASDVQAMLFGTGRADMAAYAAAKPLLHEPGSWYCYSSGTSNLLSRHVAHVVGGGDAYLHFLRSCLLEPLGMASAVPKFDGAGTWIGSSYLFATAREFAAFGQLYLDGGQAGGQRLLPEGWVDHARSPTPASALAGDRYGAHWWRHDDAYGTFAAHGYGAQRVLVVPALDAVLVRLGATPEGAGPEVDLLLDGVLDALAERS